MKRLTCSCGLVRPGPTLMLRVNYFFSRSSVTASMPNFCGSSALRPASDRMTSSVSYSCSKRVTCRSTGSAEDLDPGTQLVVFDLVGAGGEDVHAAHRLVQVAVGLHRRAGEGAGHVVEELVFLAENTKQAWPQRMIDSLYAAKTEADQACRPRQVAGGQTRSALSGKRLRNYRRRYQRDPRRIPEVRGRAPARTKTPA